MVGISKIFPHFQSILPKLLLYSILASMLLWTVRRSFVGSVRRNSLVAFAEEVTAKQTWLSQTEDRSHSQLRHHYTSSRCVVIRICHHTVRFTAVVSVNFSK